MWALTAHRRASATVAQSSLLLRRTVLGSAGTEAASSSVTSTISSTSHYYCKEQRQSYVSRAHPQRLPEFPIGTALQMVLEDTAERTVKRASKWERNAPVRTSKGKQVGSMDRDEIRMMVTTTICLAEMQIHSSDPKTKSMAHTRFDCSCCALFSFHYMTLPSFMMTCHTIPFQSIPFPSLPLFYHII